MSNLRSTVNMLVQKGQIPEPVVRFTNIDDNLWSCFARLTIEGKSFQTSAEASTKAEAHEMALSKVQLPAVQSSKSSVPAGNWTLNVTDDTIAITFDNGNGFSRSNNIRNTSNIYNVMQKISKDQAL